eukprot:Phypoly_transcript_19685.p1 GENE.Phypoly_transcript_19685~~Phypoly_transcript_19685.p1  ORF type:complete len:101 (+),score=11.26 Phypoly_transcript_19685:367-669(+)
MQLLAQAFLPLHFSLYSLQSSYRGSPKTPHPLPHSATTPNGHLSNVSPEPQTPQIYHLHLPQTNSSANSSFQHKVQDGSSKIESMLPKPTTLQFSAVVRV